MILRGLLAVAEMLAFIFGLIALVTLWWKIPDHASFWPEVGYVFAFLGIALAQAFVFAWILLGGKS